MANQDVLHVLHSLPENLEDLSKEELLTNLKHLRSIAGNASKTSKVKAREKIFDFKRYKKRHVALKLLYLGWNYDGFAVQMNTEETVESHLFKALFKTKLVECRETSNYHRCGRTDKGVSAFSQVISLDVRTNLTEGHGVITPEGYSPDGKQLGDKELDYVGILNRVLPREIRVVAWAPVEPSFSARFDCLERTYKYWFPKADLCIEKMQAAAQSLVGEHDFRNLCKLDVANGVTNYVRKITEATISFVPSSTRGPYDIIELTIKGSAFLWHQIRCIVTVLILIGQGKEDTKVIEQLLDIKNCPQKPQYSMACEIPLLLFDCQFEGVNWVYDEDNLKIVIRQLQGIWTLQSAKATIIHRMLSELESHVGHEAAEYSQADSLLTGVRSRVYKRLLERPVCESLEQKIAHHQKKRRADSGNSSETCEKLNCSLT